LLTTEHHRFWDETRGVWVFAVDLVPGDDLRQANSDILRVESIATYVGSAVMYDLTIDSIHDFYVAADVATILVHNCGVGPVRDFPTKATEQYWSKMRSEGEARALARTKVGHDPVDAGDNKLRSSNGVWQYRAKAVDVNDPVMPHVHLEQLNPGTGEVLRNYHLWWEP
jgi:hypothetical protein